MKISNKKLIAIAAIVLVVSINYNARNSQKRDNWSCLTLANIDALADENEVSGIPITCCSTCHGAFCGFYGGMVFYYNN